MGKSNYIYLDEKWSQRASRKIKQKLKSGLEWAANNKELVVVAVPVVTALITAGCKAGKMIINQNQLAKAQQLKDLYIYDRRHGHYWLVNKVPSPEQRLAIDHRQDAGEDLGDILVSMRLL